jgi:hypothetical protein
MTEVLGYMLVAICAGVVGSVVAALLRRALRDAHAHGWRELRSGAYRGYGRGLDGYVSNMSKPHYWWVTRRDRTIVEGYSKSIVSAKQEADEAAQWLLETRR